MHLDPRKIYSCWLRSASGNVATMSAMTFPVVLAAAAFGVDAGAIYFERRELQAAADVAAIVAAANIGKAEEAARRALADNGVRLAEDGQGIPASGLASGEIGREAVLQVSTGSYVADKSRSRTERFQAGTSPRNAAKVTVTKRGRFYFASSFREPPLMTATATARSSALAAFSVGSRLAGLDGGIINRILGGLTGSTLTLSVMDYESLVDARVNALEVLDGLAAELHVEAATYGDVLNEKAGIGQIALVLSRLASSAAAADALREFERDTRSSSIVVPLSALFRLDETVARELGQGPAALDAKLSAFDLLTAAVAVADGKHQVQLDLGASVPGLVAASATLSVGEPPQHAAWFAVGDDGAIVRTAQTRLRIVAQAGGTGVLSGVSVRLPLYLELASAEARLAGVSCPSGAPSSASVELAVTPSAFEAWIADVTVSDMADFDHSPKTKKTAMVEGSMIKASAYAHAAIADLSPKSVTFSGNDIGSFKPKSVATEDFSGSLIATLLGDLDLDVKVLGLGLATPAAVESAIVSRLQAITPAVDKLIANTLTTLGVRIGEADTWVNGVQCQRSVLVQ